jgi:flagellar motor switch protein FliM
MEKVLNQEEIDTLVRAARAGNPSVAADPSEHVERWDVRQAGQIGREQLKDITQLHEGFARNLTNSLGAYLRVVFTATLVSAEHLTYREFLQRIPEMTYLASCRLDPAGLNAAFQLDLKVAFPMIDLLLGGQGKAVAASREMTDIEEEILDSVARIVARELGAAWQSLLFEVSFEEHLDTPSAQRLMTPEEKTLCLSFEVEMPEVRGGLNLAIPVTVSNALLRKISDGWNRRRIRGSAEMRQRIMQRMLGSRFETELGAKDLSIPLGLVASMAVGDVLTFVRSAGEPASLMVEGFEIKRATPMRCGLHRAGRIGDAVPQASQRRLSGGENE